MRSPDPQPKIIDNGWTKTMLNLSESFFTHRRLLRTLVRLELIDMFTMMVLQRDFEQNTWAKIRSGLPEGDL